MDLHFYTVQYFFIFSILFSAGIGRTGTFIVTDMLMHILKEQGKIVRRMDSAVFSMIIFSTHRKKCMKSDKTS